MRPDPRRTPRSFTLFGDHYRITATLWFASVAIVNLGWLATGMHTATLIASCALSTFIYEAIDHLIGRATGRHTPVSPRLSPTGAAR